VSIALDAMGGDHAPEEIVAGAIEAAPLLHTKVFLVGRLEKLDRLLPKSVRNIVEIVPASETVEMAEKPTDAYRLKKDSSLMVAARLVKDGAAEAMVSAGNTGAASTFAQLAWRQIHGVHRPAIATAMPNRHGGFVLLDAGASPDVDPEHLVEFAVMGRAYAKALMGRDEPKVHLMNIGEEPGKGNAFAKQAYSLLEKHDWFAGNIEGKDMFREPCDVVVCDAFVGNAVLKTAEGVAELFGRMLKDNIPTNPLVRWIYWPVGRVVAPLKKTMDYAERGGAPLLGLNGLCVICHGRSNAKAIKNALLMAQTAIDNRLVASIRDTIKGND
jgi:glycerol-3-phosphate acyltransferase PlsX